MIPFRIIDTQESKIAEGYFTIGLTGEIWCRDEHDDYYPGPTFDTISNKRYKIQYQAGNLTDKYGNQLWDGDIITDSQRPRGKWEIKWDCEDACFYFHSVMPNDPHLIMSQINSCDIECISNILLNEVKE